jgi:hypothetical protein
VQESQFRPGLGAQLFDKHRAGILVGSQRLGLPPAPVQGEHQLPAQALAQRVRRHHFVQVREQPLMPPQAQPGLSAIFQGLNLQPIEPRHSAVA